MKKFIHCDADCFYAAIEMRDDPSLRGRPMAVGGSSDRRGVISTCNYEARRYGIRSAMASAHALRLCPDLLIVPGRMARYREAANVMRDIFSDYTDLVEPLSLDEAYLDVTACGDYHGSATLIAEDIRQKIYQAIGITVSAGVAPAKFLAKVASDWNKPNGLKVITPHEVDDFVAQLPVNKIHGVGRVTAEKLNLLGISNCRDVRQYGRENIVDRFGKFGERLWELSHGIDHREVCAERIRKSLSVEHTFPSDLQGVQACQNAVGDLFAQLLERLQGKTTQAKNPTDKLISKVFIKVKFHDFTQTTMERVGLLLRISSFKTLLDATLAQHDKPVRLLGLGVRFAEASDDYIFEQLELFPEHHP